MVAAAGVVTGASAVADPDPDRASANRLGRADAAFRAGQWAEARAGYLAVLTQRTGPSKTLHEQIARCDSRAGNHAGAIARRLPSARGEPGGRRVSGSGWRGKRSRPAARERPARLAVVDSGRDHRAERLLRRCRPPPEPVTPGGGDPVSHTGHRPRSHVPRWLLPAGARLSAARPDGRSGPRSPQGRRAGPRSPPRRRRRGRACSSCADSLRSSPYARAVLFLRLLSVAVSTRAAACGSSPHLPRNARLRPKNTSASYWLWRRQRREMLATVAGPCLAYGWT